jgi:hypothetical protein
MCGQGCFGIDPGVSLLYWIALGATFRTDDDSLQSGCFSRTPNVTIDARIGSRSVPFRRITGDYVRMSGGFVLRESFTDTR